MPTQKKASKKPQVRIGLDGKPYTAKEIGEQILDERRKKPKKKPRAIKHAGKKTKGQRTSIAKEVRKGNRKPPPVPEGKSLEEIAELDPDDPSFKHPQGRKRKHQDVPNEELAWTDSIRKDRQKRANARRAKVRKREAEIVKTEERRRIEKGTSGKGPAAKGAGLELEDQMYADGLLDMDDWDDEELIRGYRRKRNGKFGSPPKYIPREVQQAAMKIVIRRGRKKMEGAFIKATENLVKLAQSADSEKVRLEATKEVLDRVAGKVPEHLKVQGEAPYEAFLADSLVPMEEVTETTTARQTETEWELEFGGDDEDDDESTGSVTPALPSPSRDRDVAQIKEAAARRANPSGMQVEADIFEGEVVG